MIKWPITYVDYNGNTITEDFYFHLNKAELMHMQFAANGAYTEFINRIVNQRDVKILGQEFENLILNSYGEKSDDGRNFRKSDAIRDNFKSTEAFAELYMELISDAEKATKFVKGILPKDLQDVDTSSISVV